MRFSTLLVFSLSSPSLALACPGKGDAAAHQPKVDAGACAKSAELVGSACSYSTSMMAHRVLEQGRSFTYTGQLQRAEDHLVDKVAAPFVFGPERVRVIANEVLETADVEQRHSWRGKLLEVDGVTFFVVTAFDATAA